MNAVDPTAAISLQSRQNVISYVKNAVPKLRQPADDSTPTVGFGACIQTIICVVSLICPPLKYTLCKACKDMGANNHSFTFVKQMQVTRSTFLKALSRLCLLL